MTDTPFITDLRSQAVTMRRVLENTSLREYAGLFAADYDRVIVSGMGASLFALYPGWLVCVEAGLPIWWIDGSELLADAHALITPRTLLVLASQSGKSAEIVALLEKLAPRRPARIIGITNDPHSPLARGADQVVEILAGEEHAVSTKTYINTLISAHLLLGALSGKPADTAQFRHAADAMDRFLGDEWDGHLEELREAIGTPERLVILGRGPALATAWQGALICKEGAKIAAEGMSAAQFRHGPLELADSRLTAIVLEGQATAAELNRRLALDLLHGGATVLWIGAAPPPGARALPAPAAAGIAREAADIVPLEMITHLLAGAGGFVAGEFRHGGKVTTQL